MALPEDIITKVRQDFSEDDSLRILQTLSDLQEENPELFGDRILRCIIVLMHNDAKQLDVTVKEARVDWRDLICAAEYSWGDKVRDLSSPFEIHPEMELFKQWLTGQQIQIPWPTDCGGTWTVEYSEIRELSLEKVDQVKNVSRTVSDPNLYVAHLNFLCIRGPEEISLSKAIEGKALIFYRRDPETGGFAFQKFWYRPQDLIKRGKW